MSRRRSVRSSRSTSTSARSNSGTAAGPTDPPASTNTPASDAPCCRSTRRCCPGSRRSKETWSCAAAYEPGASRLALGGRPLDEPYVKDGDPTAGSAGPFSVTVPQGRVFLLGDNRGNSADSRYRMRMTPGGTVPVTQVLGVALPEKETLRTGVLYGSLIIAGVLALLASAVLGLLWLAARRRRSAVQGAGLGSHGGGTRRSAAPVSGPGRRVTVMGSMRLAWISWPETAVFGTGDLGGVADFVGPPQRVQRNHVALTGIDTPIVSGR
ncbi:S26 family signal peptidase [Streptomyces sp. NBC_01276]|uniref:S26 family signal peptidase n=1 Tax=Streptomyces sp. NBC_01276 TaxID=2903808 RepID=UPI00352E5F59